MVKVEKLTKKFGANTAVDSINFEVQKGEIVGFLGPNGAGKSTTMKMLAGFLPPTSGTAEIAGCDVFTDSLRAREHIGYMPENVPLYTDMRVSEFLRYRASLKGVPGRRLRDRISDVLELCGLEDVEKKIISRLSKGYRQRVGLADAMVHEPDLLILDEPTIGLDPNQIRLVRDLIRNLRRHHTILISTHILPEVEMLCSRVIIINKGRIEALDTPQNLRARLGQEGHVLFDARVPDARVAAAELRKLEGVQTVNIRNDGPWSIFKIQCTPGHDPRETIYQFAVEKSWPVRELSRPPVSLEQVFAEVTNGEEL
ncbi:ATP-binding cassette domain-containing protein [bacterium]|jgi:ABC-2 type transport system ATP-binding protein|nr:ATP-binding cassette domain-containing protein [bacterium]NBS51780.1 ATP-binding cassette domain-containing protein [Spartobacteria bacterium]